MDRVTIGKNEFCLYGRGQLYEALADDLQQHLDQHPYEPWDTEDELLGEFAFEPLPVFQL